MTRLLGVPEAAAGAWRALLEQASEQGTPCAGPRRDDWTGTPAQQETAAVACLDCPALAACLTYARIAGERDGTWGGTTAADRYPKAGTTKRRTARQRKEQPHG